MDELNPYESPKIPPGKEQPTAAVKKAVGFMTLAILTPIAVVIAGFASCLGALDAVGRFIPITDRAIIVGWAVFLIPPVIVLIFMGRWAIIAYKREAAERRAKLKVPPGSGL